MNDCFHVAEKSENLLSVSKLRRGARVIFGKKLRIDQENETIYPLSERENRFI